jgi:hypothetical protein
VAVTGWQWYGWIQELTGSILVLNLRDLEQYSGSYGLYSTLLLLLLFFIPKNNILKKQKF